MNKFILLLAMLLYGSYTPAQSFSVIGDFGTDDSAEYKVSALIKSWSPEFIVTLGDNNYLDASFANMDKTVGKYFHEYVYPYPGTYGSGASENRFFPCLGNHDTHLDSGKVYFDYFTLPNNERYYDFVKGNVHFFMMNSSDSEPDGNQDTSVQARWLREKLMASTSPWKLVIMHKSPFSSDSLYGSFKNLRWPFREWGATAVMTGHAHVYERLTDSSMVYFINGLGGAPIYKFGAAIPQSQLRYNKGHGAMKLSAGADSIEFSFFNTEDSLIDHYVIRKASHSGISSPSDARFQAGANFPNPFSTFTSIPVELVRPGNLVLRIMDITGNTVYSRVEKLGTGRHLLPLENLNLGSGAYFYELSLAGSEGKVYKKMIKL